MACICRDEVEHRATELGNGLADRGHAGLCPPCYAGSALLSPQAGLQHEIRDSRYMAGTSELGHEPVLPDPAGFDSPCPLSPSLQAYWYVWCPQQGWRVRLKYK